MFFENETKYEIDAVKGQEVAFSLWDYDAGFPGPENDDFLGRCGFNSCALFQILSCFPQYFFSIVLLHLFYRLFYSIIILDSFNIQPK